MKAALYLRVSTGMQAEDGISLDAQERIDRGCAAERGYGVEEAHVYREAHTGGELFERAELMRLLAAARRQEFQVVIVDCLDRWVRDDAFDGWLEVELRQVGVEVQFATETYTDDLSGGIQRYLKGRFAKEERRKISTRCRKAYNERLEQGKSPAIGSPPYGYAADKQWVETKRGTVYKATGTLLVEETEAAIIRLIFRWLLEGFSLRAIARRLNEEGIPSPSASATKSYARRGALWGVSTVSGIIRDPVYRGERAVRRQRSLAVDPEERLNRTRRGLSGSAKNVLRPPADWKLLPAPAIVSEREWHLAQEVLDCRVGIFRTRNCETSAKRAERPALLRGLLYCPHCQAERDREERLHPMWQETGRLVYRCGSRNRPEGACGAATLPGEEIEAWVKAEVAVFLQQPELIERELQKRAARETDTDLEAELERQYRLQMAATRKQERLLSLFVGAAEGEMPVAMIQRQIADAEREKEGLAAVIAAIKARQGQRQASVEQGRQLAHYCQVVAQKLAGASFENWRLALEALGVKVTAAGRKPGIPEEWRIDVTLDPEAVDEDGTLSIACSRSVHKDTYTFTLARCLSQ